MALDPVQLTADLIRCPSVTPVEAGALVLLERVLREAGFACTRVDRGVTANLFARWGLKGANKSFGFNGHTDVVPIGDRADWSRDPFGAEVVDGWMYGRGATDMKSGVAAFVAAAVDFVTETPPDGAVILAITGDEEGDATDGTPALLDWMATAGERMTHCLVGEPTCPESFGDMMKIGRRGSMTAFFTAIGVPFGLSTARQEPADGAGQTADPAGGSAAGRRHRAFRRLDAGDHHGGLRQSCDQCDPGARAGHGEHPLQRRAFGGEPDALAGRSCCSGCCRNRRGAGDAGDDLGREFPDAAGGAVGSGGQGCGGGDGAEAAVFHLGRDVGCAVREDALPGG